MKQIAKWTLLCTLCIAVGFGATVVAAQREQLARTLVAMLAQARLAAQDRPEAVEAELPVVERVPAETAPADVTLGTLSAASAPAQQPVAQPAPPGSLTAVGVIELTQPRQVVLAASGRVDEINVQVGDTVAAGDVLVALDTTYLEWAVEQAEIAFETARIQFEDLGDVEDSAVAVAEANLLLAREQLSEVEAGPTDEEVAAAESAAAAAWARVEELQKQPTPNQITQALANLRRAEIAVQAAQREYDKIAWLPEAAATSAADTLQQATIDLEAAQAAYEEATKPADESTIQSAIADAQNAQAALNDLRRRPTPAELAAARAAVASAEKALADAQRGAEESDLRIAELNVRNAMISLEQARLDLENAKVVAPIDGTILTLDVELGQQASAGTVVATIGNTADIRLTVNVEQKDISRVQVGQPVAIAIYALPNDTFFGVVDRIAPVADAETGFVTFPVVIRLTEGPLEKVLPGMTASAAFAVEGEPGAPPAEATEEAEATVEPTGTPAEEATPEAVATPAATPEPTEEPAAEPTSEPTEEPTEEPAEESNEEAAATPTAEAEPTASR